MRRARIAAVLLAGLSLASGCGSDEKQDSESRPAAARAGERVVDGTGYQLTLPAGWTNDRDTAARFELSEPFLTGAVLDGYAVNVIVTTERVADGITLQGYYAAGRRLLARAGALPGITAKHLGKPGPPNVTSLNGERAISHDLANREGAIRLRERQVIALRGDTAYTLTFFAPRRHFAAQLPEFEAILASWRWT